MEEQRILTGLTPNKHLAVIQHSDIDTDELKIQSNIPCTKKRNLLARRLRGKLSSSTRLKLYCDYLLLRPTHKSHLQNTAKNPFYAEFTEHLNISLQRLLYPKHSFW